MNTSKFIKEFEVRIGRKLEDKDKGVLSELLDKHNILDEFDFDIDEFEPDTIETVLVSAETVFICPKCGMRNHLKDGSCIRCDRKII